MNKKIIKYLKNSIGEKGNYCYSLPVETTKAVIKELNRLNNNLKMIEEENKILKGTILNALEFINNHTYRWKDTQFGEMVETEDFEPGLKPIELINILKNKFENK